MNKLEKISISRIISDLIKADTIIDSREMDLFKSVKSTYRLSQDCLCDARFMTFSDAVYNLAVLGETIHTGSRGGQYYINSNGNKTYVPKRSTTYTW